MNVAGQPTAVSLERMIPAPPARVYRAWLDPGLLVRWMAPGSCTLTRAEVDERVGGHYRIWHADPAGTEVGGFDCELAELVPDQRIVFRWGFVGPQRRGGPVFDYGIPAASKALCVRGVATIDIVDGVPEEYLTLTAKGIPADQFGQFEAHVRSVYKQMALISIEPRWARYYDFTAGRVPEFLHRL